MTSAVDTSYDSARAEERPPRRKRWRKVLVAYSFIAPNFIGFAVFTLGPMLFAFALAFMHWDGSNPIEFAGARQFLASVRRQGVQSPRSGTRSSIPRVSVPLTLVCALGLAVLLNQKIRGANFFRTAMFFPYVASLVAVAVVWNMIFNPEMGPVNMLLYTLGRRSEEPARLGRGSALGDGHRHPVRRLEEHGLLHGHLSRRPAGHQFRALRSGRLDGATAWQKFIHVTVPQLAPTTFFVTVMLTIQSFKVFDQIYMITQGGPGTSTLVLVYHIYNEAFISWDLGYASMVALVLFFLVLIVTVVQFRSARQEE